MTAFRERSDRLRRTSDSLSSQIAPAERGVTADRVIKEGRAQLKTRLGEVLSRYKVKDGKLILDA